MADKITSEEMLALVETNIHGMVQGELATLQQCAPDLEARKKYYKKHVGSYNRDFNATVGTEQKIKAGGYGNASTKNLTINLHGMGLSEKLKALDEWTKEAREYGEKMGYGKAKEKAVEAEVIPDDKGENRIKDAEENNDNS